MGQDQLEFFKKNLNAFIQKKLFIIRHCAQQTFNNFMIKLLNYNFKEFLKS